MADPAPLGSLLVEMVDVLAWQPERHERTRYGKRKPISLEARLGVYERDGHACLWCSSTRRLELDHITPWSYGGSDFTENLRTLCRYCNRLRSNWRDRLPAKRLVPVVAQCDWCAAGAGQPLTYEHDPISAYCRTCGLAAPADLSRCL